MAYAPHAEITARIVSALENGVTPWDKPWKSDKSLAQLNSRFPFNFTTGKQYRGINIVMLLCAGFGSNGFATFKQIQAAGGTVKKGEKSSPVFFMSKVEKKMAKGEGESDSDPRFVWIMRQYHVFNVAQCEGLTVETVTAPEVTESVIPSDTAELIDLLDVKLQIGSEAFYTPSLDAITMPSVASFQAVDSERGADNWSAVFYHELGHWTGAEKRLNRTFGKRFGDSAYALEELTAELTAAFVSMELGIDTVSRSAAYLASWIKVLKDNESAFYTAATAAQKAVDYIREAAIKSDCKMAA